MRAALFAACLAGSALTNPLVVKRDDGELDEGFAPITIDGFGTRIALSGAVQAPKEDKSYLTQRFYADTYDAKICAKKCLEITDYNSKHPAADGTFNTCRFFNIYKIDKNYVTLGSQCSFYSKDYSSTASKLDTNYRQSRGKDYWFNSESFAYGLAS